MTATPTGQFRLLLAHTVLAHAVAFVVRPTTSYRALELGVSDAALGGLSAAFALVPLLVALRAGAFTDRRGERASIALGSLGMVLAALVLLTSSGLPGLLAGTALLGLGHLLCMVGGQALVGNTSAASRRDTWFGYYTFAASLGQVAGPGLIALFGASQTIPDTRGLFLAGLALTVLAVAVALALRPSSRAGHSGTTGGAGGARRLLTTPGVLPALAASAVVLAAVDISLAYFPALGQERGYSATAISALLVLRAAASMGSRLLLGRLALALGRRRLLTSSVLGSAVTFLALAAPLPLAGVAAVVVAAGFLLGVGQPLTMSWVAGMAGPEQRGTAMSLRLTGNRLGQVCIPALAGLSAASAGAAGVFAATGALLVIVGLGARRLPADPDTLPSR